MSVKKLNNSLHETICKLDLYEYIKHFSGYFSREKSFHLDGDAKIHFEFIKELFNYEFKSPPKVASFDIYFSHLKKYGTLKLYEIYEFIKVLRYFQYLRGVGFESRLREWIGSIIIPKEIEEIMDYFDKEGEIRSEIDDELLSVEYSLESIKSSLKETLRRVINSKKISAYLADTQIHYLNNEECLLVRGGFNHVLKATVIGRSSSGFFYVVPESIKKLKDKENELISKRDEIKYRYEKSISSVFTKFLKFFIFIDKEFDRFDHYQARVFFAKNSELQFVLPANTKEIHINEFKHPALKDPKAISVDFTKKLMFITGVNAGGKTMLLKSILSVAFLAKYLIPMKIDAKKTVIGSFKKIVAILDDPQSVKNDISTFAGRMVEFSKLFGSSDILVGVDEIELGTDSEEAAMLFKAILDELIKKEIKIVVTTHHKKLSSMFAKYSEVELYAALYDEKNRVPTYRFLKGTIGKSYAFETALRYGIPPKIVQEAKKLYGEERENLDDLIQKNIELEIELKSRLKELDDKIDRVERERQKIAYIKETAQKEIDETILKYEKIYKELIDEVKKAAKVSDTKEIHRSLNRIHSIKKSIQKQEIKKREVFEVGDIVKFGNIKGTIINIINDEAVLESEGITIRAPINKLKRSSLVKKKKIKTKIEVQKPSYSSIKIDLHGLRAQEAIEKLDKFLSDALIIGYDEVLISHGIGTGKLAYAVKEFLKSHPKVKSFSDAPISLGGYGATIAKL